MERPKSVQSYSELCACFPGGVNSPVRAFKGLGVVPLVAERGAGSTIYDVDGNAYIDYCGSWGALIHGHANDAIVAAACERIALGSTFGISMEAEGKLGRQIMKHMPSIESLRFVSSGTEAAMSAVRLARAYTGKDLIIKFSGNYHGHADIFLVQAGSGVFGISPTSSSAGIPKMALRHTLSLPYNDSEGFQAVIMSEEVRRNLAAIIVEPIAGNIGCVPAKEEFLLMLRRLADERGALLIFDEVITGFRVALGGAQGLYGIKPDLTCLGKVIGGGFPAAAFGGRKDVMELLAPLGPVYQAGTLSGNPVAMEAGLATLQLLERPGFYEELERKTSLLVHPVQEFLRENAIEACLQRVGSMFTLFFGRRSIENMEEASQLDRERFADFFRYMLSHGIYIPPAQQEAWFVSAAHSNEELSMTRDLILSFLAKLTSK